MSSNQPLEGNKAIDKSRFDQTKETFVDKLKNYQALADYAKNSQKNESIKRTTDKLRQKLHSQVLSPRYYDTTIKNSGIKNNTQQFKFRLYSRSQQFQQTSHQLMSTKFITQQRYLEQQLQKIVNQVAIVDGKYISYKDQQQQMSRGNFLQLDNFQKYLVMLQKGYQVDYAIVTEKGRQLVVETVKRNVQIVKDKHKSHLQSGLKILSTIDQQSQLLKQGMNNESQLCEGEWCDQLDKINEDILALNNFITETRLEENDRVTDAEWRIKEMQFSCEESLEKEHKERLEKQSRLYAVMEKLIQRVGSGV